MSRTGELVDIRYADGVTIAEFIKAKRARIIKTGGRFFFVRSSIDTSLAARRRVSLYHTPEM
jgi:hypothetical protein